MANLVTFRIKSENCFGNFFSIPLQKELTQVSAVFGLNGGV